MIEKTAERIEVFKKLPMDSLLTDAYKRYSKKDWIYIATTKYASKINSSRIVVLGSSEPWIEALSFALNADSVVSVDYNYLSYGADVNKTRSIQTVSEEDFDEFYKNSANSFDVAFSISSVDHSGLGRYGDPLDGRGDFTAMKQLLSILKPGGLLFLSVPIGPDVLVFNLHRRYGQKRLPELLSGWDIVDRVAWVDENIRKPGNWRQTFEPVHILSKPGDRSTLVESDEVCVIEM